MAKISHAVAKANGLLGIDPAILKANGIEIEPDPDATPAEKLDRFLSWGRKANIWKVRGVAAVAAIIVFFLTWMFGNLITSIGYNKNDWLASAFAAFAFALAFFVAIAIYVMVVNTLSPRAKE